MNKTKPHIHTWNIEERRTYGAVIMVHVCSGCSPTVERAFDMAVVNRDAFMGKFEALK